MFQLDVTQSVTDLSRWSVHKLLIPNNGHLAKPLVPHICFTDPAADILTHLTSRHSVWTQCL